ncbi:MAG: hypothetical protein KTR35_17785 [Gammaproteobacteria bacterium]|nr:hypothetical protein [Gammaproteobacteria bacterium]
MDKSVYHSTLKAMHEAGVNTAYYHGWATGALDNPDLEEQRVTDAYTAGFEHGKSGNTEGYKDWVDK